jgi:outer membrane autotransporter protein
MRSPLPRTKILAAAVLCSLLSAAPVWASSAPPQADDTVTTSNTAGTRYTSINVTQESATAKYQILGINSPGTGDMTVYMAPGATISVSSTANGTGVGMSACGISNADTALTVDEALNLKVTAATAAASQKWFMYVSATGITNSKGNLNLGRPGAANTITVKADAGTYTGATRGLSVATALGMKQFDSSITISGATTINAEAQGLTPGSGSKVSTAQAEALGIGSPTNEPIPIPYPISTNTSIKLDDLTGTISARGGTVNTGSEGPTAAAIAGGIRSDGKLTAASANLKVTATGGTAAADAQGADVSAAATGLSQIIYYQDTVINDKLTLTGPATLTVSATGGGYEGTGSAGNSSATAVGIGGQGLGIGLKTISSYDLSDVTAVVTATGGTANAGSTDLDHPTTGGDVSASATGVLAGQGSLTARNLDLTVTAQGGAAAGTKSNVDAYAYGLAQTPESLSSTDTSTVEVAGTTRLKVAATGGTTTGSGQTSGANTMAAGVRNSLSVAAPDLARMTLGDVSGTVTATGGTVQAESAFTEAIGVMNGGDYNHTDEVSQNLPGGILTLKSLDLSVTATGARLTGKDTVGFTLATGLEQSSLTSPDRNLGQSTLAISGATNLQVTATGATPVENGTLRLAETVARGLALNYDPDKTYNTTSYKVADLGPVTATVTATGATGNSPFTNMDTEATGLYALNQVQAQSLALNVTATGGKITGTQGATANSGSFTTRACGISMATPRNTVPAQLTVPGATNFTVSATGATAADGASVKTDNVWATGLAFNDAKNNTYSSSGTLGDISGTVTAASGTATSGTMAFATGISLKNKSHLTTANVNLDVRARGGAGNPEETNSLAIGLSANDASTLQVNGDATIKAAVTPANNAGSYGTFLGAALAAVDTDTVINVGTDGTASLHKTVQLEGDVLALDGGTVNLTLSNSDSYLQGNVRNYGYSATQEGYAGIGTVNLTLENGGTWRPVYDNRYGDFGKYVTTGTGKYFTNYAPTLQVPAEEIVTLTLRNGGVVDLTWDNPTRSDSFRQLYVDLGKLSGAGGVFKINSDLANNRADRLIMSMYSAATQAYIDVAYDPYLSSETLTAGKSITGRATVAECYSSPAMTFIGKQDSYNLYTYTPTLVNNGDGTWDLTALTIDSAKVSGHVKSGAQDRLGLNSLFQFETNSLSRRLGELRDADKTSGIWARYYDGKLEQGDASLKANLFQAGYDKRSDGKTEKTYRGAALSYAKGDGTYALGSGNLKETTFSLYQTGIKHDGRYYDVVLKAGKYMNDYDVTATANPSSADYSTWAYSLSGEIGKRIQLGKGLYVEPQAELILGRLNGADYTTSTGMNVSVDAQNKAITRLGLAFGKSYARGSLYGKFSYYHDFGTGVDLNAADGGNSVGYSEDLARNWTELTIGGSAKLGKNANAYAEVSKYMGQLSSNVRYNIGARWSF